MILKLSFLLFFISINSFAINVLITKTPIKFEELITIEKIKSINVQSLKKACIPVKFHEIKRTKYITTHYVNKGSVICRRDVKEYRDNGVIFNFGVIQIEKKGKIVFENENFIRIKRPDGTIEKIYKNGKMK